MSLVKQIQGPIIDLALGIGIALVPALCLGYRETALWLLAVGWFAAWLPDADLIPWFALKFVRQKWGWEKTSHFFPKAVAVAFSLLALFGFLAGGMVGNKFQVAPVFLAGLFFLLGGVQLWIEKKTWWERRGSHWIIAHHPAITIHLSASLGWTFSTWVAPEDGWLFAIVAGLATFAHFLHDSCESFGLHWFSPIRWEHYQVTFFPPHVLRVPDERVKAQLAEEAKRFDEEGFASEISSRV